MEMIQKKIEGQDITSAEPASAGGDKNIDLMAALKASLSKTSKVEVPEDVSLLMTEPVKGKQMVS